MGFIASQPHTVEYGHLASLLLQMTDELGLEVRTVRTVTGGFEVDDRVSDILAGTTTPPAVAQDNTSRTPPPSWSEPLPELGVELVDGKVVLTAAERARIVDEFREIRAGDPVPGVGREEIRAWARANRIEVADKGRIAQRVVDLYAEAHE